MEMFYFKHQFFIFFYLTILSITLKNPAGFLSEGHSHSLLSDFIAPAIWHDVDQGSAWLRIALK